MCQGLLKVVYPCSTVVCWLLLADDQISVKVNESGWAWMVCGERLIIWKICQTAVAKVQFKIQILKIIQKLKDASSKTTTDFQSRDLIVIWDSGCAKLLVFDDGGKK